MTLRVEPRWPTPGEIIETNRREVEATGEPHLVINPPLLESACARPQNLWSYNGDDDVVRLAASLAAGIARNHAFQQGNKRTAVTSALMFLALNGYDWMRPDDEWLANQVVALVTSEIDEQQFAELMRPFVSPME